MRYRMKRYSCGQVETKRKRQEGKKFLLSFGLDETNAFKNTLVWLSLRGANFIWRYRMLVKDS